MTIIFFDGPDGSKKTTIARSISTILEIPFWERGQYLPHHHSNLVKDGSMDLHQDPSSIWYIIDEMKTIELFKKLGKHVIIDRHPKVSECVYRRIEGKPSKLEYEKIKSKDEIVVLCHDMTSDDREHDMVLSTYQQILGMFEIPYFMVETSKGDIALDETLEKLYQCLKQLR